MAADLPPEMARAREACERAVAEVVERLEAEGIPPALLGPCLCATGVEMTLPELGPGMTTGMLESLIKGIKKGARTN